MTDFTSLSPSSSSTGVNAVTTQLSGLQIGSPSPIVNASSLPMEKRGVHISVFEDLVNEHAGKEYECQVNYFDQSQDPVKKSFDEMTTTDVCEVLLKPIVSAEKCSYVDYLVKHKDPSAVSKAQVFISHAWKYKFTSVVDALRNHFQDKPNIFIWFDLFSNNQIEAPNLDFAWWSDTFQNAIQDFGHVVMVISPWKDPIPFKRGWCLFEMYVAKKTNSTFEVAMSEMEKNDFLKTMNNDINSVGDQYLDMLGNIDVGKSECHEEADQSAIFALVDELPDKAHTINTKVCEAMREWCLNTINAEVVKLMGKWSLASSTNVDENQYKRAVVEQKHTYASMLNKQGKHENAKAVFTEVGGVLELYIDLDTEESTTVAKAYNDLGDVYRQLNDFDNAFDSLERSLGISKKLPVANHLDIAETHNNLGLAYYHKKNYEKALHHHEECLNKRLLELGGDHPEVGRSYNNIGLVYQYGERDYPKALEHYLKSWNVRKANGGEEHPDVATIFNNMGTIYHSQRDSLKALEYFQKSEKIGLAKLGGDHHELTKTYNNMGLVYGEKEDWPQALEYLKKSLDIGSATLGGDHHELANTYYNMGLVYSKKEDWPQALEYLKKSLDIGSATLGGDHHELANTYFKISLVYYNLAQAYEQEGYFRQALKCLEDCLSIISTAKLGADCTNATQNAIERVKAEMNRRHSLSC